ncbi:fimbrial protein [Pseudomonas edaphica]|uniref:Fimbrial protein n=2 Tax=Gammaproteobacteria TaxID=1236 RepID=A0A7Y8KDR4_9PSED|nr:MULTISPECIES: fimbrial protein [Pseudomonas]NVZ58541.1 fimbrial protein [Pseudomonas edaphica]NWC47780.1 fimbrial protein [Pseudomonas sp. IPO3747]NWE07436.1 fimbrial protein [Pseudomonas edaphica]NWE85407.1 fimbrial protein [Pseudomonas edaphica]
MKSLYGALALLALAGFTTTAHAVDCRVNGGAWQNGNPNLQVPVTVTLAADRTRLMLEGARLECRFTYSGGPAWHTDFWVSGSAAGTAWTPGPKFAGEGTGLRINGAFRNTPVPSGIAIANIPNNGVFYPINVTPYILLRNYPSNPFDVRIGDNLGLLRLTSSNNYDGTRPQLTVTYTAANNFTVSPSTCTINNNNPIEINFGDVHQRAIGSDPLTSSVVSNRRLTYSCPDGGINTPITITYKGTRSAFDPRLLIMSNPDVGTALLRGGAAVSVNGSFLTRITNSVGGDDVTFSLVRRNGSLPTPGAISGSGVLVMGVP